MKTIDIIPSKSIAHRALICAAFSQKPCEVICEATSDDIEATKKCMEALKNADGSAPAQLYCGESGSTFRFLIPFAAALGTESAFHPEGRLPERPLSPMYEELEKHGVKMSPKGSVPFTVKGKLKGGDFRIPGNVSSQYISGLLMALPMAEADSRILVEGELQSSGYVDITLDVIRDFGIRVGRPVPERGAENGCSGSGGAAGAKGAGPDDADSPNRPDDNVRLIFSIPGSQQYDGPAEYRVEGDWSNAAFWLAAGALGREAVRCGNLNLNSVQGDKRIFEELKGFGARIHTGGGDAVIAEPSGGKMRGKVIDAEQIPDMVPVLALVAALADGKTEIINAGRLRIKESDRLKTVTEVLDTLGADIRELPEGLEICGVKRLRGGTVDGFNDHRIVMMAAVASLVCSGKVRISGWKAVNKSYPAFFEVMKEVGLDHNLELI